MASLRELLLHAAARAADYREEAAGGPVFPLDLNVDEVRDRLGSLRDHSTSPETAVASWSVP